MIFVSIRTIVMTIALTFLAGVYVVSQVIVPWVQDLPSIQLLDRQVAGKSTECKVVEGTGNIQMIHRCHN